MCGIADAQQTVGEPSSGFIATNVEQLHIVEFDLADVRSELWVRLSDSVTQRFDALGTQALVRTLRNETGDLHVPSTTCRRQR